MSISARSVVAQRLCVALLRRKHATAATMTAIAATPNAIHTAAVIRVSCGGRSAGRVSGRVGATGGCGSSVGAGADGVTPDAG
jgi:hypothetical protein